MRLPTLGLNILIPTLILIALAGIMAACSVGQPRQPVVPTPTVTVTPTNTSVPTATAALTNTVAPSATMTVATGNPTATLRPSGPTGATGVNPTTPPTGNNPGGTRPQPVGWCSLTNDPARQSSLNYDGTGRIWMSDTLAEDIKTWGGICDLNLSVSTTFVLNSIAGDIKLDGRQIQPLNRQTVTGTRLVIVYQPNVRSNGFDVELPGYQAAAAASNANAPRLSTTVSTTQPYGWCTVNNKQYSLLSDGKLRIWMDLDLVTALRGNGGTCLLDLVNDTTFTLNSVEGNLTLDGKRIPNGNGAQRTGHKLEAVYEAMEPAGFDVWFIGIPPKNLQLATAPASNNPSSPPAPVPTSAASVPTDVPTVLPTAVPPQATAVPAPPPPPAAPDVDAYCVLANGSTEYIKIETVRVFIPGPINDQVKRAGAVCTVEFGSPHTFTINSVEGSIQVDGVPLRNGTAVAGNGSTVVIRYTGFNASAGFEIININPQL